MLPFKAKLFKLPKDQLVESMIQRKFSYWKTTHKNMVASNIAKAKNIETGKDGYYQAKKVESKPKARIVTHLIPAKTKEKLKIKY